MTAARKSTLVVADEQALFCEGLAMVCESTRRFRVVGACCDGRSALKMIRALAPDVAVLDIGLPKMYSLAVVKAAREAGAASRFVVLSTRRDHKTVIESLRSGASGYVLKTDPAACLLEGLGAVVSGVVYVSPQLRLVDVFSGRKPFEGCGAYDRLSAREHQVFTLLVEGLRAKEIANRLDLSPKTVDTYRASLMTKLNIHDVAGLVKFAIRHKLIPLS